MRKNVKQIAFILLLFFVVGMVTVFAITEEDYNFYYKRGYLDGYAGVTRANFARSVDPNKVAAYSTGYAQGVADRKAGKDNYFFQ